MSWSKLLQRIEDAATDLAVVTIRTEVTTTDGDATKPVLELSTRIDQVTGDIENHFTESAFKLDYGQRVLDFHEQQRGEARAILERNVAAIRQLLDLVWDATNGQRGGQRGGQPGAQPVAQPVAQPGMTSGSTDNG